MKGFLLSNQFVFYFQVCQISLIYSLQASVAVDVMPGQYDPTNYTLPQQPLHRCMFPLSVPFPTLQLVSNPYQAIVDGVQWVTTCIFILYQWYDLVRSSWQWMSCGFSQVLGHSRTEYQWYCEVQQYGWSSGNIGKHTEAPPLGPHRSGHTGSGQTTFSDYLYICNNFCSYYWIIKAMFWVILA